MKSNHRTHLGWSGVQLLWMRVYAVNGRKPAKTSFPMECYSLDSTFHFFAGKFQFHISFFGYQIFQCPSSNVLIYVLITVMSPLIDVSFSFFLLHSPFQASHKCLSIPVRVLFCTSCNKLVNRMAGKYHHMLSILQLIKLGCV